jgi:hypothetical protein
MGAPLMADSGTSLAPDELDRLEDALERWTDEAFEPGPEDSLLPTQLRERLAGYREVLAATREALPLVDVGDDVLAGVLAEAHRGDAKPRAAAKTGPGWWERVRRSMLLPGVALAGSAALLLYLVQPNEELTLPGAAQDEAPAKREEARLAPEPGPAPAAPSPAEMGDASASPAPPAAAAEEKLGGGGDGGGGGGMSASGAADPKDSIKADRPKSKMMRKDMEADMPAAEAPLPGLDDTQAKAADKEELRDTLERADKARHTGDCQTAMPRYLEAMLMDGAPTERAQARAGYGLCMQQEGEEAKATRYFDEARKLWPGIDGWLGREGGDMKKPSSKKSPAPAPKAKPKAPVMVDEPLK